MVKRVRTPDGYANFPDDMPDEEIERILAQEYPSSAVREQNTQARQAATQPQAPAGPNRAQATEAARMALARQQNRTTGNVLGLGATGQQIVNTLTDPARRTALGRSAQGFARDVQSIPSLNLPQLATDTARNVTQSAMNFGRDLYQNPMGTIGNIAGAIPMLADEATIAPFRREEQQQQALDLARIQGDPAAMQRAAQAANAATGQSAINVAAPVALGGSPSALRAAAVAGGASAPSALSGPGTLQERIPQAVPQIGLAATLGGGLQMLANAAPRVAATQPRSGTMQRAGAFERQGVNPTMAAVNGGMLEAGGTQLVRENLFAGAGVRNRLNRSLTQTRDATQRLTQRYGTATDPENAGRVIQDAVARWARENVERPAGATNTASTRGWSFEGKANALYDHVMGNIVRAERAMLSGNATVGGRRMVGGGAVTTARNARAALEDTLGSIENPAFREGLGDPQLERFAEMLQTPDRIRFNDLRVFRSRVGQLMKTPSQRIGLDEAGLRRLYGALSDDIYESAQRIGGARAVQALRRVDQFYKTGNERLQNALREFDPAVGQNANNPASAFDRILARAQNAGRANTDALLSLKRTLRPDEWRTVQASLIERMGRPMDSAGDFTREINFSVERFANNYRRMSPEARRVLFGSRGGGATDDLAAALDDLHTVATAQQGVEQMANRSRSGSVAQNVGSVMWLMQDPMTAIPALVGAAAFGELMTNPAVVRWITSAPKAGQSVGGVRRHLVLLTELAGRDPAVAQLAAELSRRELAAGDGPAGTRRQVETASQ